MWSIVSYLMIFALKATPCDATTATARFNRSAGRQMQRERERESQMPLHKIIVKINK